MSHAGLRTVEVYESRLVLEGHPNSRVQILTNFERKLGSFLIFCFKNYFFYFSQIFFSNYKTFFYQIFKENVDKC